MRTTAAIWPPSATSWATCFPRPWQRARTGEPSMAREVRGRLDAAGRRVAVVASRFNEVVTKRLVEGAVAALEQHGVASDGIVIYWVAGAFEVPQLAAK